MKLLFQRMLLTLSLSSPAYASHRSSIDPDLLEAFRLDAARDLAESGLFEVSDESGVGTESDLDPDIQQEIEKSVFKILVRGHEYDFSAPWKAPDQTAGSGTGFLIDGKRIVTNAHVVADAAFIQVLRRDQAKKYVAKVQHIDHDCDLAILRVEDARFFVGLKALKFGGLPAQREAVETFGYPAGGESLSVTRGTISRIEVQEYAHSGYELLVVQTDAAINPGNSGGPVIDQSGRVVGVAFQGVDELQNAGYLIPVPVVEHFLKHNAGHGFPELGIDFQDLGSPTLRERYKVKDDASGMLVTHVKQTSPAVDILKVGDVVLSMDGIELDNEMKYPVAENLRVGYLHLIHSKFIGDKMSFRLLREGVEKIVEVSLPYARQAFELIPSVTYDKKPDYYIYAGLVFQPLTANCFGSVCSEDVITTINQEKRAIDQQIVVLNRVLAAEVNDGYHDFAAKVVAEVNGTKVHNLKHLIDLIETHEGEYQEILFSDHSQIVLCRSKARTSNSDILASYSIQSDRSQGLVQQKQAQVEAPRKRNKPRHGIDYGGRSKKRFYRQQS